MYLAESIQPLIPLSFAFQVKGEQLGEQKRWTFCYSAPSRLCHRRGAQVHGAHQAASHIPTL